MTRLYCHKALLPDGWATNVSLTVTDGRIASLDRDAEAKPGDVALGCVIPGMPNAHSHVFQRALAGWTEMASPAGRDNFWSWRESMYRFAAAMTPERLRAIARQAYIEMVSAGYTSVAEFHYLHSGAAGADGNAMLDALVDAAAASGIRLTYVPVHYERAGFDDPQPTARQQQFAQPLSAFLAHVDDAMTSLGGRVAVGAHSLRAVSAASLGEIAAFAQQHNTPMHLHIAEQTAEVEQCLSTSGQRPVSWLFDNVDVDERWCLVHATHIDDSECAQIANSGAVACICPSTEGNLGDGLFPLPAFLGDGGHIAIGSDSHVTLNPFEELRWLEYGQRLISRSRNVAAEAGNGMDRYSGYTLFQRAVNGGAAACGLGDAGLVEGGVADLVSLNVDDPMLAAHGDETRMDALVFSGYRLPVDKVMVAGDWCVSGGEHADAAASARAYAHTVRGLTAESDA